MRKKTLSPKRVQKFKLFFSLEIMMIAQFCHFLILIVMVVGDISEIFLDDEESICLDLSCKFDNKSKNSLTYVLSFYLYSKLQIANRYVNMYMCTG